MHTHVILHYSLAAHNILDIESAPLSTLGWL